MATNHDVWDAVVQSAGTPANSFEFLVKVQGADSTWRQSGDVTAVNPAFTPKTRARQTYAAKGTDSSSKYGDNLTLSFDVEAIRDANGAYQPFLQDLLVASRNIGVANTRTIQVFDALGADYAIQGVFTISVSRSNTGWDDAGFFTVTAEKQGAHTWITNPVLTGNVPIIAGIDPTAGIVGGGTFYVRGSGFTGVSGAAGVKFGSTNATSYVVVSDSLLSVVMPGTGATTLPVTVTNANGTSQPVSYNRL